MVKKNLVNKNVIRALSIGLSVAMMSQPLTAMAANEGEESGSSNNNQIEEKVDNTSAAQKAEAQAEVVDTAVNENEKGAVDLSKEAASKANDLGFDVSKVNADVDTIETEDKIGDVKEELQTITSETEGEALLPSLEEGVNTAEGSVKAVVDNAYDSVFGNDEKEIESLDNKFTNADTAVKEASGKISGAKTTGEANNAYNEAAGAVKEADDAVNAAEEAVQTAEKELTVAKDDYDSLAEKYELALETYNTLVEKLNTAKAKALEAAGIEDNKATEENEEVVGLTQELANAEADLAALKQAVTDAENNYKKNGYGYIAALENVIIQRDQKHIADKNPGVTYGSGNGKVGNVDVVKAENDEKVKVTYRNLFKAIVETYYVKDVIGSDCTFVNLEALPLPEGDKYYYNGDTTDPTNESTPGDVLRTFKLTYKKNGVVQEPIYLNYKTANENNQKGYKGIVIFEKTEHEVLEGIDIDNLVINENNGEYVDIDGVRTLALVVGDKVYYKNTDGKTVVLDKNGEKTVSDRVTNNAERPAEVDASTVKTGETKKAYTYGNASDDEVFYSFANGVMTKTVTNKVTVTTYTGERLDAQATDKYSTDETETKKAYVDALVAKIPDGKSIILTVNNSQIELGVKEVEGKKVAYNVATNEVVTDSNATDYGYVQVPGSKPGTTDETYGYTVNVSYSSKFEKTINLGHHNEGWTEIPALFGADTIEEKRIAYRDLKRKEFTDTLDANTYEYKGIIDKSYSVERIILGDYFEGSIIVKYETKEGVYLSSSQTITTTTDENAAKQAAKTAVRNAVAKNGDLKETRTVNDTLTTATPLTRKVPTTLTTYGYGAITYVLKSVATPSNVTVQTETWNTKSETSHTEYRNDNWYSGNVISISVDKNNNFVADYLTDGKSQGGKQEAIVQGDYVSKSVNLVEKINAAKAQIKLYDEAKDAIAAAEAQVKAAENEVGTLKNLISQIEDHTTKQSILNDLRTRLGQAKDELETAKTKRDQLLEDLKKLDGQRDQKVKDLTPSGEGGGDTTTDDDAATGVVVLGETLADAPAANAGFVAPGAPGVGGGAAAPAAGDGELVDITQQTATSDAVPEKKEAVDTTNIEQTTATAAAPINEEAMTWWWLLIIAVLGGAGYAMYRKYQAKKEEKVTK